MPTNSLKTSLSMIDRKMKLYSRPIHTDKWQSIDISRRPEAAMRELTNVTFTAGLPSDDLKYYQDIIKPNTPWADRHFVLERVSGSPINPGTTWREWPYSNSANSFLSYNGGNVRSPTDWAYLAGLIDGDGGFSTNDRHGNGIIHPRIKITQLNREYLTRIQKMFNVGTLREYSNENNPLSDKGSLIWRISAREEVRWVLTNTIPFLNLKKAQAQELLTQLPASDNRSNDPSFGQLTEPMFDHTYAERYWCKFGNTMHGIRYQYGDLDDVVKLLVSDPLTRQAYLPVWFPEDTGVVHGKRVPCSLGYHFWMRENRLSVFYAIRSCDWLRHARDDIYLTIRLLIWVLQRTRTIDSAWKAVRPGELSMWIGNLHLFVNDWNSMYGKSSSLRGV